MLVSFKGYNQSQKLVVLPNNYAQELNIIYKIVSDWEGKLDLYYPKDSDINHPLIINIHGGGWNHGTKESQTGFNTFFKRNCIVANIEYRLVNQSTAPAAIEDARDALLFLVKNASSYNIDPQKILIMGSSAGGHLALMTGLLGQNSPFDSIDIENKSFKIIGIFDKYGITDLSDKTVYNSKSVKNWLGDNHSNLDFVASVSPINYIQKNNPAVLIIHGDEDQVVPYEQSIKLYEKLQLFHNNVQFITISKGGHGKFDVKQKSQIQTALINFLNDLKI